MSAAVLLDAVFGAGTTLVAAWASRAVVKDPTYGSAAVFAGTTTVIGASLAARRPTLAASIASGGILMGVAMAGAAHARERRRLAECIGVYRRMPREEQRVRAHAAFGGIIHADASDTQLDHVPDWISTQSRGAQQHFCDIMRTPLPPPAAPSAGTTP